MDTRNEIQALVFEEVEASSQHVFKSEIERQTNTQTDKQLLKPGPGAAPPSDTDGDYML